MTGKVLLTLALLCFSSFMQVNAFEYNDDNLDYSEENFDNDEYFVNYLELAYKNVIWDLLAKLKQLVNKAFEYAQKGIDLANEELKSYAKEWEASADTEMTTNEENLLKQLNELKLQAESKNVSITECLGENEGNFNKIRTTYHNTMDVCVTEATDEGTSYAQSALDKIKSLVETVENIKEEIQKCGSGFSSVACLAKLAYKVEEEIRTLPSEIVSAAKNTVAAIFGLRSKVKECTSDATSKCTSEEKKLFGTISACIKTKIDENNY